MTTYLMMWQKIKALTEEELDAWIRTIAPSKGLDINFNGLHVIDVDLLEALRHWKNDISSETRAKLIS